MQTDTETKSQHTPGPWALPAISLREFAAHNAVRVSGLRPWRCVDLLWRWIDMETAAIVGPQYHTRAEALADLEWYAFENWGLGKQPAALKTAISTITKAVTPEQRRAQWIAAARRLQRDLRHPEMRAAFADAIAKAEGR